MKALFYISNFDDEQFTKVINKSHTLVTLPRERQDWQVFLGFRDCTEKKKRLIIFSWKTLYDLFLKTWEMPLGNSKPFSSFSPSLMLPGHCVLGSLSKKASWGYWEHFCEGQNLIPTITGWIWHSRKTEDSCVIYLAYSLWGWRGP